MTLPVMAADTTLEGLSDDKIGLSYSNASDYITWTASGQEITGTAKAHKKYGTWRTAESTLTIRNNWIMSSGPNFTLSFDYEIQKSTNSSVTINDSPLDPNQNKMSITLKPGASATVTITASKKDQEESIAKITMANVTLAPDMNVAVTFQPAENGHYTVDGITITEV